VELRIPKLRKGSYFPGFLEPQNFGTSTMRLLGAVQMAFACRASRPRVRQLIWELSILPRAILQAAETGTDDSKAVQHAADQ
jgi:hypothetical protein